MKKQPKKQPGRTSNTFTGFKPANTVAADASVSSASTPRPEAEAFLKRFKNLAKVEELVKLGNVLFDGNTMKVPFHVNGLGGTFVVRMERGQMKISLESFYTGSRGQLVKEMRETFKHMKSNGTQLPRGLFRIVGSDRVFRFPSSAGVQILQGFLKFIEQTRLDRQSDHQVLFGSALSHIIELRGRRFRLKRLPRSSNAANAVGRTKAMSVDPKSNPQESAIVM